MKFTWQGALVLCQVVQALAVSVDLRRIHDGMNFLKANSNSERFLAQRSAAQFEARVKVAIMKVLKQALTSPMDRNKDAAHADVDVQSIAHQVHNQMDVEEAIKRLDGKLPPDVASLVSITAGEAHGAKRGEFDESSLQKARNILNDMMLTAWGELDDIIFECKEFQERNRGTYTQVVADLARLGSHLGELNKRRVSASECIMEQDRFRKETEGDMDKETTQFNAKRLVDDQEMTIRRNDLAVFDMILTMTQCPDSQLPNFMQIGQMRSKLGSNSSSGYKVCSTHSGTVELSFDDPKLEAKVMRALSLDAKKMLRAILEQSFTSPKAFIQLDTDSNSSQPSGVGGAVNTTTAFPTFEAETLPVTEEPHPSGQWKKCVDGPPNCGLLHDLMSLEWGKFRDSFDELATEMTKDQDFYDKEMGNFNDQLAVINSERTKCMELLAETISAINADTEESNEKDDQKRDLTEEYDRTMAGFAEKCEEILYTRICGVRKVRNQLMWDSTVSPPSKISDCDFTDWYPKDGVCLNPQHQIIECDDACPMADPYACGGLEMMTRDVVVSPNEYGMVCPDLNRQKKCKQYKCPVDCVQSEWSGWSKCTKECEGGVAVRTRSILTKAKNGGRACDTVQEEESCNTGSCDRDCTLDEWTEWSPCSVACGGGITNHYKRVLIPIRGQGTCPGKRSADRFMERQCNEVPCVGDEICIAQQDLVMTIDSSGSLRESGFEIVRSFAANLTAKYMDHYFGRDMMKVGVVQFGNGALETQPDGTTTAAPAIYIQGLTSDINLVCQLIEGLSWQKGFTNMAQAFQTADTMLGQTGRNEAQSAVLTVTDGKYSMAFQTAEKARELKDKNVMIYMAVITENRNSELDNLKKWASQPWETNYVRIPGLAALEFNSAMFATEVITKFCPKAVSPSRQEQLEDELQCVKIRDSGSPDEHCGGGGSRISPFGAESPAVCADTARESGGLAFMLGKGMEAGKCAVVSFPMTDALFEEFQANRRDPQCPGGAWNPNPFWDVYACKALENPCGPGSGYGHLDIAHSTLSQQDLTSGPMIFSNIGYVPEGDLSLEVTASGNYDCKNPSRNGMNGAFGQINIKSCTSADFTFTFKQGGSNFEMQSFEVSFFDLDKGGSRVSEGLTADGYTSMTTAVNPFYTHSVSGTEATITANQPGVGADNPSDPMMLTPEQISRSVAFVYENTASFQVHFNVECNGNSNSGRNYLFAFHNAMTPCRLS